MKHRYFGYFQPPHAAAHAEDARLARRLHAGERQAFDEFFAEHFQRLFRFCLRRVAAADIAEDLTQETLIKALKGIEHYRGEAALHTWLCQICRNEISSWYRQSGARRGALVSLDDQPEVVALLDDALRRSADDPGEVTAREELVHLSLDALPAAYGDVLEMKYIEGLSVDEIAYQMNRTVTAIQSKLARARDAFRSMYNQLLEEQ